MDLEAVPIIKFDIENIRQTIRMHLGTSVHELGEKIEEGIESAVASYDFDGKVTTILHEVLSKEIDNFFKFGFGRQVVKSIIEKTLNEAFNPYEQKVSTESVTDDG